MRIAYSRYRYLVNVGSNGYANKLKYLFLCGSVVIHVHDGSPNHEFFESQLLPGMHYYPVSRVEEVADAVRHLRAHPAQARAIAAAGTKRMEQLSFFEVTRFLADTFKEYGRRMTYKPERGPTSFEVSGVQYCVWSAMCLPCCALLQAGWQRYCDARAHERTNAELSNPSRRCRVRFGSVGAESTINQH